MDTDEFLKRCQDIMKGLHLLADDLYEIVDEGILGKKRDDVLNRSREKVRLYDDFMAILDDEDHMAEARGVLEDYIQRLRNNIQKLERTE